MQMKLPSRTPIAIVRAGHEKKVGVIIGKRAKFWILDIGNHNTLLSGSREYCDTSKLLTVEYLSTISHRQPCLLLFQSDETNSVVTQVKNCGYRIVLINTRSQCDALQVGELALAAAPIAIFVNSSYLHILLDKLLRFAINECTDCKLPAPVFVFLPQSAMESSTLHLLMAQAKNRRVRFIVSGSNLDFYKQGGGGYAFDVLIKERDDGGVDIYKRGYRMRTLLICKVTNGVA